MYRLLRIGCVGCLCLVVGCHSRMPPQETTLQQITKTLKPYQKEAVSPPKAVKEALLPPVYIAPISAKEKTESRFDVVVSEVPAKDFFLGLVEGTPYNITVHPSVTGNISLQLNQVSIPETLEIIRDLYGYEYEKALYGFKILPAGLRTQIFQIDYLNLQRFGESQTRISAGQVTASNTTNSGANTATGTTTTGGSAPGTQIRTSSNIDFWKMLEDTLKLIIGIKDVPTSEANVTSSPVKTNLGDAEERMIAANPQSGVVLVRAMPQELRAVRVYLDKTQLSVQRQVILEAKILEVELKDGFQAGIDWSILSAKRVVLAEGLNARTDTTTNSEGTTTTTTTEFFGPARDANGQIIPKKLPLDDIGILGKELGGVFSAALSLSSFKGLIQLLETQGNVQVLSSPQVSTVNNQKAVIRVGNDEFFVTGINISQTTSSAGTTSAQTITPTLTPLFSGIALDVTPQISENGYIILHVHPSVSDIRNQKKDIPLGTAGAVTTQAVDLALSQVRESDTIVRARDGQVVVIGGLIQNRIKEKTAGLPWLSSIPYLGSLFRQIQQSSVKSELVILLRPRLVDPEVVSDVLNETEQRVRSLERDFHNWKS